jgi:integrase
VWELTIVGKGQRERSVPVSAATLNALRAHWLNRAKDFERAAEEATQSGPLLAPIIIPWTGASRRRHRDGQGRDGAHLEEAGYTADGLNRLISRMVTELVETTDDLSLDDRRRLGQANAHVFRHYLRRRTRSSARCHRCRASDPGSRVVADDFNLRAGGASAHAGGCSARLRGR